ncbi:hypothetical protein DCAR_0100588 [Daucus carota subsp. sativus]|uniref:Thioredoxin-like fold domain-containing protein n=1 Tax=Daucus carota subsp. sativus TaxID=79200 RepID=A0AAF0W1H1_DAUCS|nr:PREDICTED: probable nucleoredoxin 1 isoform X3 [Daucus carota subsp. sativus]WOG81441.1 hypothetical protein DCAR_0100588 [Daucus carota subsp. sativus]
MMYYNELKTKNQNFELVLLYLSDTHKTTGSTKENFQKTFETMPWLVLPFKDPVLKKLKRLFGYPDGGSCFDAGPSLVLVGPRKNVIGCGDIIEPGPASIFREYYDGDLFSREEFAKIERGRVGELKLEMLCSPNTFFKSKDGSQVQFSQLAGKRIIFLFEGDYPEYDGICFRGPLYSAYMDSKGTANEFEVIYFPNTKEINDKSYNRYHSSLLLAFGRDGSLVRKNDMSVVRGLLFSLLQ